MITHGASGRLVSWSVAIFAVVSLGAAGCSSASSDARTPAPITEQADESTTSTTTPPTSMPSADEPVPTTAPETAVKPTESASKDDLAGLAGMIALRNADGDLVISRPDGSDMLVIASGAERLLTQPTWARDGDRLAWSALDQNGATLEIGTTDGATTSAIDVQSPPFYLSWSPQDTWIAALRPISGSIGLLVADTNGFTSRQIGGAQPFYFDWEDDTALVAAVGGQALARISATTATTPEEVQLELPLGLFQAPGVLRRDPRRIVATVRSETTNDVVTLDEGRVDTTLGRARGPVSIAVNGDGRQIAVLVLSNAPQSQVISYQADQAAELADGRVSIIDVESGSVETRPEQQVLATQWSPDGSALALLQLSGEQLQWTVVTGDSTVTLTPFTPSREFASAYLPFADQYNHSSSWWSPDGRAVVFSGTIGDETGVWVDLIEDDLGAVLISDGDIAFWSPQ